MKYILVCLLFFAAAVIPAAAVTYEELNAMLKSETAVLMDADTGLVLFERDMHKQMRPASTTKVMTALLALERGNMDDTITMSYDAVFTLGRGAAHIALDVDEELTLEAAMYALAIRSANDATNGVAEHIGESLEKFNKLMNDRAVQAGALNTNFANAHGMPHDDHLSTAYDLAKILIAAIGTPGFCEFFSALRYELPPTNKQEESRVFESRNPMLSGRFEYDGIIAGKTGFTNLSQHTLVTAAERDGRRLVCVVLKSPDTDDKYVDTTLLLDYGFEIAEEAVSAFLESESANTVGEGSDGSGTEEDEVYSSQVLDEPQTERGIIAKILRWVAVIFAVIIGLCVLLFIVLLTMRWINVRRYKRRKCR
jgi:D-alanyl-D-alanine carboxypeptidase (penicillin-binding protein 5/6)